MNPDDILETIRQKPQDIAASGYLDLWNPEEQARIDEDIETNRKCAAAGNFPQIHEGAEIRVEQASHEFIFGAHLFNYEQLGSEERNARHKALYGTLFNSATIPFYWKTFEPMEGHPRFEPAYEDSAEFWNSVKSPGLQPHWRRPATDPLVDFCEQKRIRCHGHPLVWGNKRWHTPKWVFEKIPARYRGDSVWVDTEMDPPKIPVFDDLSPDGIEALIPEYAKEIHVAMARRIAEIGLRYRNRVHSWDVVNESATDFGRGNIVPGKGLCKSWYGLLPGDYPYRAFKLAEAFLPPEAVLNINDYHIGGDYLAEIEDLKNRGCRIDIAGAQMHLFNPQTCQDIADGKSDAQSPAEVRSKLGILARAGTPIHMSEITITSPAGDERGELIQAIIARNLYRLWFSLAPVMGITWWNVVDGCGAPGEPAVSGLFTRDMQAKAAYHALNDLIRNEWRTRLSVRAGKDGGVNFRGFPGSYILRWRGESGDDCSLECSLLKSGRLQTGTSRHGGSIPASPI